MKVAVLQFFSWPGRRVPLPTVYARAFERIAIMDQSGYDAVWLAEHHFSPYSVCPSTHVMGSHVAARTQSLRIGMGVSLAAFYDPLRLAEEVALLDVLSGGRVNWGAGRGFDPREFQAFGVPREESYPRFRENVDIVLEAWSNERLTYHGKYRTYEDIEVLPKPLQQPHPPVWLASSSVRAIEWAAERGFTIMMDPHSPHAEIAKKRDHYQQTIEAHGHSMEGREIPMTRLLAVGDTRQEAERVARAGVEWMTGSYISPERGIDLTDFRSDPSGGRPPADLVEHYLSDVVVYGTPDEVRDQLERLREEMKLQYLLCAPLSHRSFVLFTDHVLPHL